AGVSGRRTDLPGGVYAAISSWVVGFNGSATSLVACNLAVGVAVTVLAFGFAGFYGRTRGLAWVLPLLGVWLIVAAWVVRGIDPHDLDDLEQCHRRRVCRPARPRRDGNREGPHAYDRTPAG